MSQIYYQVLGIITIFGNYYIDIVTHKNKEKMLGLNKAKKLTLLSVAVLSLVLFLVPVASSIGDNAAFAHKSEKCDSKKYYKDHKDYCKEHDDENHDGKGNLASQDIGQFQSSSQNSQCVSGGNIQDSCNNTSIQNQQNSGNNGLAQQGGGSGIGDNLASQGIGQFQSSSQNSQCVSGGDIQDSCNNTSIQNQQNSGNNGLAQQIAQQVGSIGDNLASQIIGQVQSSFQNSQVVSGGDIVDSGNSINLQNLLNTGNIALGQQ